MYTDTPKNVFLKHESRNYAIFKEVVERGLKGLEEGAVPQMCFSDTINRYTIRCLCEEHEDKNPSVNIEYDEPHDRILIHCHVCDSQGEHRAYNALCEQYYSKGPVKENFRDIWEAADTNTVLACTYLESGRGLEGLTELPPSLRWSDNIRFKEYDEPFEGILFSITDSQEKQIGILRLALNADFTDKADIPRPKRALGKYSGGHFTVYDGSSDVLFIGEGPETSFSIKHKRPPRYDNATVWSAISSSNFLALEIPDKFKTIHIFADNDVKKTGLNAAYALARKLLSAGKKVFVHLPDADIPISENVDFNDRLDQIETVLANDLCFGNYEWERDGFVCAKDFKISPNGIFKLFTKTTNGETKVFEKCICDFPFYIKECSRDVYSFKESVTIKYLLRDTGFFKDLTVDRFSIQDLTEFKKNIVANASIASDSKDYPALLEYLRRSADAIRSLPPISRNIEWVKLTDRDPATGAQLISYHLPPFSDRLRLIEPLVSPQKDIFKNYKVRGTVQSWEENVLSKIMKCPGAALAFGFHLVSPLLYFLPDVSPFSVSLCAESTVGKTFTVNAIFSAFCLSEPGSNNQPLLRQASESSAGGFANVATYHKDLSLCFDDVNTDTLKKAHQLIFSIGNSGGDTKLVQSGDKNREPKDIRSVVFFTSEFNLTHDASFDGVNARMVVIEKPPLEELSIEEFNALKKAIAENYGAAGKAYIQRISEYVSTPEGIAELKKDYLMYVEMLQSQAKNGEKLIVTRLVAFYAAALLATKLFSPLIIKTYQNAKGEQFTFEQVMQIYLLNHWQQALKERPINLVPIRALETIQEFVTASPARFIPPEGNATTSQLGEFQKGDGGFPGNLAIIPSKLSEILGPKYNVNNVLSQWKSRKILVLSDGDQGFRHWAYINKQRLKCIVIRCDMLFPPEK